MATKASPPKFIPPQGNKPKMIHIILGILGFIAISQLGLLGRSIRYLVEEILEDIILPLSPLLVIGLIIYFIFRKKNSESTAEQKDYQELMGASAPSPTPSSSSSSSSSFPSITMSFLPQRKSIVTTFFVLLVVLILLNGMNLWGGYGRYGSYPTGASSLYVPYALESLLSLPLMILYWVIRYVGWLLLLALLIIMPFAPSAIDTPSTTPAGRSTNPMPRSILGHLFLLMLVWLGSDFLRTPIIDVLRIAGSILSFTLTLAIGYAIVRAFGFSTPGLDQFFEHYPIPVPEGYRMPGRAKVQKPLDWRRLSLDALRLAGIALILSALFALFFNIEWSLARKVLACVAGMLAFLGTGEALRRQNHLSPASLCMLGAFALAQYGVTLGFLYLQPMQGIPEVLHNPHLWLFLKLLVACAFLFTITISPSKLVDAIFTIITYSAPYSMLFNDIAINLPLGGLYLCFATVLFLVLGIVRKQPMMWMISSLAANSYLLHFFGMDEGRAIVQALEFGPLYFGMGSRAALFTLCIAILFFIAHLIVTVVDGATKQEREGSRIVHLITAELMALIAIHALRPHLSFLSEYIGIAWIIIAAMTFAGYVFLHGRRTSGALDDSMLHISMIFSAVGIFIQANGPWSAVAFLAYAILLLWYSFQAEHKTTKVYGFIVLGIAILKLYSEFVDIFKSVPGTVIILCLGLVLIVLSYRFDVLKLPATSTPPAGKSKKD